MGFWSSVNEVLGRATEKKQLNQDQREDWTAAVIVVRERWYPSGPFKVIADKVKGGMGWRREAQDAAHPTIGKPPSWAKVATGYGPIMLAWEAHREGAITKKQLDRWTWDTVLWISGWNARSGKPVIKVLSKDFGRFKRELREQLDAMGLERPRTDEAWKFLGYATIAASIATAGAIIFFTAGIGTPVALLIAGGGMTAAGVGGVACASAAERAEQRFHDQAAESGVEVELDKADGLKDLGMGLLAGGTSLLTGGTPEEAIQKAKEGYYADELQAAKDKAAADALAAQQAKGGDLATWAKSTPGMLTIGVAALLVVILVARK